MGHSYRELFYHLTWSTKYRSPLIVSDLKKELLPYLKYKAQELGCQVFAVNAVADHVHMLLGIPSQLAVAAVVKRIKGSSSHELSKYAPGFAWQEGYGVVTLRKSNLKTVRNYIKNQEEHHRKDLQEDNF